MSEMWRGNVECPEGHCSQYAVADTIVYFIWMNRSEISSLYAWLFRHKPPDGSFNTNRGITGSKYFRIFRIFSRVSTYEKTIVYEISVFFSHFLPAASVILTINPSPIIVFISDNFAQSFPHVLYRPFIFSFPNRFLQLINQPNGSRILPFKPKL